ncbi:MAG: two-component system response regulator NarL [Gammaproteobacteria bacterium]|nr:MAG: two-component system response regulator NarL [Gammaproteobacteria bacterium]
MNDPQTPNSVIVIDDHPLFRRGAVQLFELDNSFELIGDAAGGEEGIELILRLNPDLVLLDLNMKGMDGIEVLKKLNTIEHDSIIIMLTVSNSEDDIITALRCGADGYLLKDMEPEEILIKLRQAIGGQTVLEDAISSRLVEMLRNEKLSPPVNQINFTIRENQIVALIAEGKSNKVIARELGISDGTVKVHVKNILRKLNLSSRLEIAVWAFENDYAGSGQDQP